jgi:3,4-dihydroxy 2-butanone 4-phosphate synthase/GTP cyclohydrolase II
MQNEDNDILGQNNTSVSAEKSLQYIGKNGGVFVLLSKKDNGKDDVKTYGVGAQILADIGVKKMQIIGEKIKFNAIKGFGLSVDDYINLK